MSGSGNTFCLDPLRVLVSPVLPAWICQLVIDPLGRIRRRFERLQATRALLANLTLLAEPHMLPAEKQAATFVASVRLTSANTCKAPVDCLFATWVITDSGHTVANVALPLLVVAN